MMLAKIPLHTVALAIAVWVPAVPAFASEAVKPILDSAGKLKPDAIKLWERLVNIDSGTGDAEGIKAVGAIAIEELRKLGASIETVQVVPDGSPVANYAFDVTPARLVTGLITERGVLKPSREGLRAAFPERAGERR